MSRGVSSALPAALVARRRAVTTATVIAARLGVDRASVSRWERGERCPWAAEYEAIVAAFERAGETRHGWRSEPRAAVGGGR